MLRAQLACDLVRSRWSTHPLIHVLGPPASPSTQLPIFSFTLSGLHHNLVNLLLNDLFGIQCRSGCFCAQPYVADLLGVSTTASEAMSQLPTGYWPGATRVSFPATDSDEHVHCVVEAVRFVAERGWLFLPEYMMDPSSGRCKHVRACSEPTKHLLLDDGVEKHVEASEPLNIAGRVAHLERVANELLESRHTRQHLELLMASERKDARAERSRSFVLPSEVLKALQLRPIADKADVWVSPDADGR